MSAAGQIVSTRTASAATSAAPGQHLTAGRSRTCPATGRTPPGVAADVDAPVPPVVVGSAGDPETPPAGRPDAAAGTCARRRRRWRPGRIRRPPRAPGTSGAASPARLAATRSASGEVQGTRLAREPERGSAASRSADRWMTSGCPPEAGREVGGGEQGQPPRDPRPEVDHPHPAAASLGDERDVEPPTAPPPYFATRAGKPLRSVSRSAGSSIRLATAASPSVPRMTRGTSSGPASATRSTRSRPPSGSQAMSPPATTALITPAVQAIGLRRSLRTGPGGGSPSACRAAPAAACLPGTTCRCHRLPCHRRATPWSRSVSQVSDRPDGHARTARFTVSNPERSILLGHGASPGLPDGPDARQYDKRLITQ